MSNNDVNNDKNVEIWKCLRSSARRHREGTAVAVKRDR